MRKLKYKRGHFYVSWFTLGNGHKTRFHILCKFSIPYEVPPLINVRPPKSISYTLSGSNIEIFDLPWGLFSVFSVFFKNDVTFPICLNSICKEKKYNFSLWSSVSWLCERREYIEILVNLPSRHTVIFHHGYIPYGYHVFWKWKKYVLYL